MPKTNLSYESYLVAHSCLKIIKKCNNTRPAFEILVFDHGFSNEEADFIIDALQLLISKDG